jgi:hypothetical protein
MRYLIAIAATTYEFDWPQCPTLIYEVGFLVVSRVFVLGPRLNTLIQILPIMLRVNGGYSW